VSLSKLWNSENNYGVSSQKIYPHELLVIISEIIFWALSIFISQSACKVRDKSSSIKNIATNFMVP